MRGLFSLSVVVFHIFFFFLPAAITGDPGTMHLAGRLEHILSRLPQFLYNGNCGVCVFFVLSGFVLAYRFWPGRENSILRSAALRRYFRLTIPALASIFLAYLILKAGWMRTQEVSQVAHSFPLVAECYRMPVDAMGALKEGLWGIYFGFSQQNSFNPVLWTMEVEFKGSFLSFAFLSLFGTMRRRWMVYPVLVLLFWNTYYLSFVLGVALSDLACSSEGNALWQRLGRQKWIAWLSLGIGILLSSYSADGRHRVYRWLNFPFYGEMQVDTEALYHILGAACLIYAVLQESHLRRMLEGKFLVWMGKYSFALYLVHGTVICSLGGVVFLHFLRHGYSYGAGVVLASLICAPVIALLSWGMHRYVERAGNALSGNVQKWMM